MTIKQLMANSIKTLGITRLDAEVLLCYVLNKNKAWLKAHDVSTLTETQYKKYSDFISRRRGGEPVAYIVGSKEFYGREFKVNKHVLVPRPESEGFIELLKSLRNDPNVNGFLHNILDMGTGSGCLAITTKLEFADTFVTATDTSTPALKVAIANAAALSAPIVFKKQSLLTNDKQGYDVILANLPYVPDNMKDASIMHEPRQALFSGNDGLNHYRKLFDQLANKHIRFVMTESLVSQHESIHMLAATASYQLIQTDGLVQLFRKTPYTY